MSDSKDSEMENSASERASYTSGEIPESEIPQDRISDSIYTEADSIFHTKEDNKSNARKLDTTLRHKITMHGYMLLEPYTGSAKAKSASGFSTRWLLVHQQPAQLAQKGNLKPDRQRR